MCQTLYLQRPCVAPKGRRGPSPRMTGVWGESGQTQRRGQSAVHDPTRSVAAGGGLNRWSPLCIAHQLGYPATERRRGVAMVNTKDFTACGAFAVSLMVYSLPVLACEPYRLCYDGNILRNGCGDSTGRCIDSSKSPAQAPPPTPTYTPPVPQNAPVVQPAIQQPRPSNRLPSQALPDTNPFSKPKPVRVQAAGQCGTEVSSSMRVSGHWNNGSGACDRQINWEITNPLTGRVICSFFAQWTDGHWDGNMIGILPGQVNRTLFTCGSNGEYKYTCYVQNDPTSDGLCFTQ